MYTIYTISDPDTSDVVYVGKTSNSLKARLSCHKSSTGGSKISKWMAKMKAAKKTRS